MSSEIKTMFILKKKSDIIFKKTFRIGTFQNIHKMFLKQYIILLGYYILNVAFP